MSFLRHFLALLVAVITAATPTRASAAALGIDSVTRLTAAPALYGRVDFTVMLTGTWEDPYNADEIRLDLELTAPSGKCIVVPGFFERGTSGASSVWRARFAPRESGDYRGRFAVTNRGEVREAPVPTFRVKPTAARGFLQIANAWTFRFDNGEYFRGIGENLGWESRASDDSRHFKELHESQRYHYEYLLATLGSHGGNFFRTWMCPWNLPLEWKQVIDTHRYTDDTARFNASAIQRMDQLVEIAEETDTYFMLALDAHGSLLGHGWENNPYNQRNGGPAATPAEFFTHPLARRMYRDRLRYLVARWGYNPHLAVWEFFNEVDNAMHAPGTATIPDSSVTAWHAEMSAYLRGLDPYGRPITTSISHRDIAGLTEIPNLDFHQRHIYKRTDAIPETIRRFARETGKPYVIGEFSYEWDWNKNFADFGAQMDTDFRNGLWLGLFSPTPILPMSWWWEFFDSRGLPDYFARVRALHEQMLAAGRGNYEEVATSWSGSPLRHVLGVRCGKTIFILLGNREAQPVEGKLSLVSAPGKHASVHTYDPDTRVVREQPRRPLGRDPLDGLTVPPQGNLIVIVTEP